MSIIVEVPYQNFTGLDGKPLTGGLVYIGQVSTDPTVPANQVPIFWDEAMTIPASQPLLTNAGYIVRTGTPSRVFVSGHYSMSVKTLSNSLVYYEPDCGPSYIPASDLSGPNGGSFIGGGATVVTDTDKIRALKKTSASKFCIVDGPTTSTVNGSGAYYLDASDLTTPDDNFFTIVATDGGRWKRNRLIWQTTTSGADAPTSQIARNTSHTGGTSGFVVNAFNVSVVVGAGVTNYEWAFLSQMDNSATAGENVAIYGQSKKRAAGSTWAGCLEIQDISTVQPAVGSCIGLELACSGNGSDPNLQRNGVHVAMGKLVPGGLDCEWGIGVRTSAGPQSRYVIAHYNESPFSQSAFKNVGDSSALAGSSTFNDSGKASHGVDLTAATYDGSAIRLAAGQRISFDVNSTVRMSEISGNLVVAGGRLQMNSSFSIPAAGNTAPSAVAGTSGALPAQVAGYLIFTIDGASFRLPYYG